MTTLPNIEAVRKTGDEVFTGMNNWDRLTLKDFWQWSRSDLLSNATRGVLAEYIVASALGINKGTRKEWDAYDLKTENGLKIEVKPSAYIQSWHQKGLSKICFGIGPTFGWDCQTNVFAKERKRQADVYVFCLLHYKEKETINPMDLSQWTFYVVCTKKLEEIYPGRKTITLARLKKLCPKEYNFANLKKGIEDAWAGCDDTANVQ